MQVSVAEWLNREMSRELDTRVIHTTYRPSRHQVASQRFKNTEKTRIVAAAVGDYRLLGPIMSPLL